MGIYTVGSIITGQQALGLGCSYPRPLLCDGEEVGIVDSDWGPAIIGEMDEDEARERFPEAFRE